MFPSAISTPSSGKSLIITAFSHMISNVQNLFSRCFLHVVEPEEKSGEELGQGQPSFHTAPPQSASSTLTLVHWGNNANCLTWLLQELAKCPCHTGSACQQELFLIL